MIHIEQLNNPAEFYAAHSQQMDMIGAAAFGKPATTCSPDVAAHFKGATLGQVFQVDNQPVGFALYNMLRGSHWRNPFA